MKVKDWEFEWQEREVLYMEVLAAQKRHIESFNCKVCGAVGLHRQVVGGRCMTLCNYHYNEWLVYVRSAHTWSWYVDLCAEYDTAVCGGSGEVVKRVACLKEDVLQALCELSGKWLGIAIEEHDTKVFRQQPRFAQKAK